MDVFAPESLEEALEIKLERPDATPVAGGTDLMVDVNARRVRPTALLDLSRVEEIQSWRRDDGRVFLGAGMTFAGIERELTEFPPFVEAARSVASPQIRNRATIGGNLATASPAGDSIPVLAAYEADVVAASADAGWRRIPLDEFLLGPKRTSLARHELILGAEWRPVTGPASFVKVGRRNAMVIAVASVCLQVDGERRGVRLALGSVGPTVLRAPRAEDFAEGADWNDPATLAEFGRLAAAEAQPIDDLRGTAAYRRHVVEVLARRALARIGDPMLIHATVNGTEHVVEASPEMSLLTLLRDELGLTGTKNACEEGECGSCSVWLDGEPVCSCLVPAAQVDGREVRTVDALAEDGEINPLQDAFLATGAVQCGFCTPGLLVAAGDLLERRPDPDDDEIREALVGNFCRCTGYQKIVDAVHLASGRTGLLTAAEHGAVGESARRVDGVPKVTGAFVYGSDLHADGMLHGVTVRSPHPSARIQSIDVTKAEAAPGVRAVLTAADVPGKPTFGLEYSDQPVLASDVVRYEGEPVALVAAETVEHAHRAAELVEVEYELLPVVADMEDALRADAPQVHEFGNVLRHVHILHGDPDTADADVWVEEYYETPMQDAAALGPEGALAIRTEDGGVELHTVTQWLHADRQQLAPCLDIPEEDVRIVLAGVGGAFGSREDIHVQIHACMLALRTGRPVKMVYGREESFHGHVHRHPSRTWIRYGATRDGRLVAADVRLLLDGGAYASSSPAVLANASTFAAGPYGVPNVRIEATVVYTNNPPCGAMRGFGAPQACFAYESAMDALAARLGVDPVALRLTNALRTGSVLPAGQVLSGSAPVREVIERCAATPLPEEAHGKHVKRGVGFAVGFKNIAYSEGFDDTAEATVTLTTGPEGLEAEVRTAAVDYGQGLYTVLAQTARTELGVDRVTVLSSDTSAGSAGSTSASRQTTMAGAAVQAACREIRAELDRNGVEGPISRTVTHHHRRTTGFDEEGQGTIHVAFSFVAERAVVDVDEELGLARVVQIAVAQDAGRVMNPQAAEGQAEGGAAIGLGLALLEELRLEAGHVRNGSFTDYLIPTALDVPPVLSEFAEVPEPSAPYGVKGIGELATVAATPAIVSALRAATGRALNRVPVTPDDLIGLREPATTGGRAPIPDVPGQQAVPEYLGLGLGQQELMKAR